MGTQTVNASLVQEVQDFEHSPELVLAHVTDLVDDLLRATSRDQWPAEELVSLVGCLRGGVLERVAHEERELVELDQSDRSVAHLKRDHVRLRAATDVLARAAAGEGTRSPAHIAAMARGVLMQLRRHIGAETAFWPQRSRH